MSINKTIFFVDVKVKPRADNSLFITIVTDHNNGCGIFTLRREIR